MQFKMIHENYNVRDLDASLAFYEKALGLREVRRVLKENGKFCCATYGEHGMMEYIHGLFGMQPENGGSGGFTLQNGGEKLSSVFSDVQELRYEDALEVTDVEDMVDYIHSLTGMSELKKLSRDELRPVLAANMHNGILHVPKEYGRFIAR